MRKDNNKLKPKPKHNYKAIVIYLGIIVVFSISVAYSVLSIMMKVNSNVLIKGTKDIRIIGIENSGSSCGYDKYNPKNVDNMITVNGELPGLECRLEYRVMLVNNSDLTMQLVDINDEIYSNDSIVYELDGVNIWGTIKPNTTVVFNIVFKYMSDITMLPENTSIGAILEFIWQQYNALEPILVLDSDYVEIGYGSNYNIMQGVRALDVLDGDITEHVVYETDLNLNVVGRYEVIYSVTNSLGETAFAIKTFNVIDDKIPVINLSGQSVKELLISDNIDLKSLVTAYDEYDGNIINNVIITSNPEFDNNKIGTYTIFYDATDYSMNRADTISLTVTVFEFTKIVTGLYHTLALTSHGKVYAFGQGTYGQLGQGNASSNSVPTLISSLNNIVDVAAGEGSSYALTADGIVYAWGYNLYSRLGLGDATNRNVPTQISSLSNEKIVAISSTYASTAALTVDGRVYTWGYGGYGVLGTGNITNQSIPILINIDDVKSISMGWYHGGALRKNGELYLWGTNLEGQMGLGNTLGYSYLPTLISGLQNVTDFSCGGRHTIAVVNLSDLYAWGYNDQGQVGDNSTTTRSRVVKILSEINIRSISAGYNSSIMVDEQGRTYSWGYNNYGKLGLDDTTRRLIPTLNPYILDGRYVQTGNVTSFIVSKTSRIYGMGYNLDGQLGDGTTLGKRIPTLWVFDY